MSEDQIPGEGESRPRILFVGLAESSHTISWIELLRDRGFEARLFALPSGIPPPGWDVPTYVTARLGREPAGPSRKYLYPARRAAQLPLRAFERWVMKKDQYLAHRWLARVVRRWRPNLVHTFGIEPGSVFFLETLRRHDLRGLARWVVQVRGGPDLALHRLLPERQGPIREVLGACDQVVADNRLNYRYAAEMGCGPRKLSNLGPVPGSGGVDVRRSRECRAAPASSSRRKGMV